jgi:hypothetical protein
MRYVPMFLALVMLVTVVGCSGQQKKKEPLPLDQVPEAVMKVAKEKLPNVTFQRAFKEPNGDFELIGKDKKGKTREIDVSPSGEVTQIE